MGAIVTTICPVLRIPSAAASAMRPHDLRGQSTNTLR
uniref:Uncharacterized protein n=1 Tax=Triticum urartu TaxID=4572 RepID=A0A8R7V2Q4_TRIUA